MEENALFENESGGAVVKAKQRPRDALFDALCAVGGHQLKGLTAAERGKIQGAHKQLTMVGASPQDVLDRANRWSSIYPGATLTVNALASHWSELSGDTDLHRAGQVEEKRPGFKVDWEREALAPGNPNVKGLFEKFDQNYPKCPEGYAYNGAGVCTCGKTHIRSGHEKEAKEWLRL